MINGKLDIAEEKIIKLEDKQQKLSKLNTKRKDEDSSVRTHKTEQQKSCRQKPEGAQRQTAVVLHTRDTR